MSAEPQFLEASEFEDAEDPKMLLLAMQAALEPLLLDEKARIESEIAFLNEVYSGITGGADLEGSSSLFVDLFLLSTLSELGFT